MRTRDPKSFVSVGAPATAPPTRLLVTYMSAQEESSKLEAIAIKRFIILGATASSSPRADRCVASVLQLSCRPLGKMRDRTKLALLTAVESVAPAVGFEPTTNRLTADRSTTELRWITIRDSARQLLRNCA